MREVYDYVVVDTAPNFSETMLAAMDLSDRIFVILTAEMTTIKNTRLFLEVAGQLGYGRDKLSLVLNRADSTGGVDVGELERSLGHKIPVKIVSDGRLATYALNQGEPFVLLNKKAEVTKGVYDLAALAQGAVESKPEPATPKASPFGSLARGFRLPGRPAAAAR
jgi:pilus assembly protein CpaE